MVTSLKSTLCIPSILIVAVTSILLWNFDGQQGVAGSRAAFGGEGTGDLIFSAYSAVSLLAIRFTIGRHPVGWKYALLSLVAILSTASLATSVIAAVLFAPPSPISLTIPYLILVGGLLCMYASTLFSTSNRG